MSGSIAILVGEEGRGAWQESEVRIALERLSQDVSTRIIPVLLPGAGEFGVVKMPPFLRRRNSVDLGGGIGEDGRDVASSDIDVSWDLGSGYPST